MFNLNFESLQRPGQRKMSEEMLEQPFALASQRKPIDASFDGSPIRNINEDSQQNLLTKNIENNLAYNTERVLLHAVEPEIK